MSIPALDLFAGPGGWDEGIAPLGIAPMGVESDEAACATREAAGHLTICADVSKLDPREFEGCELLIASPPCQAYSMAGKGDGRDDVPIVLACAGDLAVGVDTRDACRAACADPRSLLVVEPLRFALALRPRWVVLEQVPPVLELWRAFTHVLELRGGYRTWAGLLSAERYGVPQVRQRAFLMASLDGQPEPPRPTHQEYVYGEPAREELTIEGPLLPWVSMADALGWDGLVGFPRRADDGAAAEIDGEEYRARDFREAGEPAVAVTEKARSWTVNAGRDWKPGGTREDAQTFAADAQPAVAVTGKGRWFAERPATTIAADPRVFSPGGHIANDGRDNSQMVGRSEDAIRVELADAAVLQGFRRDYPFQGNRSKQFEQVGNAVPPPLARAVVASLLKIPPGLMAAAASVGRVALPAGGNTVWPDDGPAAA